MNAPAQEAAAEASREQTPRSATQAGANSRTEAETYDPPPARRRPNAAPSLGGVETLVTRPATTSHAGMSAQDRERLGVTDDLVRISCGIESSKDLIEDFARALEHA